MNAETMTDKPAPCPFCGGEALIGQTLDGAWYAWCAKDFCARLEAYWRTEAEALTAWNARTVQDELVGALRSNVATMEEQRRRFTALGRSCAELTTAINETRTAITRATGAAS